MRTLLIGLLVAGCQGDDGGSGPGETGADADTGNDTGAGDADTVGDTGDTVDTGDTGDADTGASDTDTAADTPSPSGLDERPSNTTCLARDNWPPDPLSQTGCVDPDDPTRPASGLIPFGVNHPFWSDGADKQRWMALPDGATIGVDATTGDWDLPVGTVLMKELAVGGTRVETRLLWRGTDGKWNGQAYVWEDDASDAWKGSGNVTVGGVAWKVPSANDCQKCHTAGAGGSLGPETGQLNRTFHYASTGRDANQLATLEAIGVFATPIGDPASLTAYPAVDGSAPVEDRARAYLHANCAMCHRPDEDGLWDGRWTTASADMGLCGASPQKGSLGDSTNELVAPGDPAHSIVSLRMHSTGGDRMPQVGSYVVDDAGVALIDAWIAAMTGCP